MKKHISSFAAILFVSFALFSCSSSDDKKEPELKDLLNYPYSKLSEADQKTKLAAEGEATMKQVEALPNEASVKLLDSFNEISDGLFSLLNTTPETDAIKVITKLSKYFGEYEWNATSEEWIKTNSDVTDKLIAIFPATKTSKINDGKIVVTAISSSVVIDGHEIPSKVVGKLYASSKEEGEITAVATGVNETSFAETANIAVALGAYKLLVSVDKKDNKNQVKAEFLKGSNLIINADADLEATITSEMLKKYDISSVKDANAVVRITKDLVVAGYIDGKSLLPELDRIEEAKEKLPSKYPWNIGKLKELEEEELALEKERIAALNSYSNLALVSTSENYKVAKISFALDVKGVESEGIICDLDKNGSPIVETVQKYTYTCYYTNDKVILNFNDETKVSADVFFGGGFSKIIEMWNNIVSQFN
ncbi:MAG: hypothetical protein QM654_16900 [Dysgonamonadaceae bacterium]